MALSRFDLYWSHSLTHVARGRSLNFQTLCLLIKARYNFKHIVFSYIIRADSFSGVCLFCISVRNEIYLLEIEMLDPVILVRYILFHFVHKSSIFGNWSCRYEGINSHAIWNYWTPSLFIYPYIILKVCKSFHNFYRIYPTILDIFRSIGLAILSLWQA